MTERYFVKLSIALECVKLEDPCAAELARAELNNGMVEIGELGYGRLETWANLNQGERVRILIRAMEQDAGEPT